MSRKPKVVLKVALLGLLLTVMALPAQAAPVYAGAFLTIEKLYAEGHTVGGLFHVKPALGSDFDPFVSFCLQETEAIDYNTGEVYEVKAVSYWAENEKAATGGNDVTLRDYLDVRTAWIYNTYLAGDFGALGIAMLGTAGRSDAVQNAIWCIEGETMSNACSSASAQIVMAKAKAYFDVNPPSYDGVRALNLLFTRDIPGTPHKAGDPAQDILSNPVPEPTSMLLFGSGLAGLAGMMRRRKR
jgi:hypothetical protein